MSLNYREITDLLKYINKSALVKFELEEGDFKLKIVRQDDSKPAQVVHMPPAPAAYPSAQHQPHYPLPQVVERAVKETTAAAELGSAGENNPTQPTAEGALKPGQQYITSPMIGTFYRAPAPDKPDYVAVGDTISVGQTLCIIEAMKLFNEIESEVSGKIVAILVDNATPVEYDQPLFVVETAG